MACKLLDKIQRKNNRIKGCIEKKKKASARIQISKKKELRSCRAKPFPRVELLKKPKKREIRFILQIEKKHGLSRKKISHVLYNKSRASTSEQLLQVSNYLASESKCKILRTFWRNSFCLLHWRRISQINKEIPKSRLVLLIGSGSMRYSPKKADLLTSSNLDVLMACWRPFDSVESTPCHQPDLLDLQIAIEFSPYDYPMIQVLPNGDTEIAQARRTSTEYQLDDAIHDLLEHPSDECSMELSARDPFHFDWPFW